MTNIAANNATEAPNEFAAMLALYDKAPEIDCGVVFARSHILYGGRVFTVEAGAGKWQIYFHYNGPREDADQALINGDSKDVFLDLVQGDKDKAVDRAWKLYREIASGRDPQELRLS